MEPNHNKGDVVKNVNGTSKAPYSTSASKTGDSWLETANGEGKPCSVKGCGSDAEVGAHTRNTDGRKDDSISITPMCQEHNNCSNTDEMQLKKNATSVPLNPENR
ncbi:SMURF2 [Acrasis kona]|uniref:SMURF2 n=1 Tax=Acrasis kona TaxID=1008807 RepID=A0AAW2Z8I7_9EUKA